MLVFNTKEYIYDGSAKQVTVMGKLPEGVEIEYQNNYKTNPGLYVVTASFIVTNPNVNNIETIQTTLEIKKDELSVTNAQSKIKATISNESGFSSNEALMIEDISFSSNDYDVLCGFEIKMYSDNTEIELENNSTLNIELPRTVYSKNFRLYSLDEDNNLRSVNYTVSNNTVTIKNAEATKIVVVNVGDETIYNLAKIETTVPSITIISLSVLSSLGVGLIVLKRKLKLLKKMF